MSCGVCFEIAMLHLKWTTSLWPIIQNRVFEGRAPRVSSCLRFMASPSVRLCKKGYNSVVSTVRELQGIHPKMRIKLAIFYLSLS